MLLRTVYTISVEKVIRDMEILLFRCNIGEMRAYIDYCVTATMRDCPDGPEVLHNPVQLEDGKALSATGMFTLMPSYADRTSFVELLLLGRLNVH